ncbi:MAG: hypothetical protein ACYDAC_03110 [Candidatus Dormibacteria bacterium]
MILVVVVGGLMAAPARAAAAGSMATVPGGMGYDISWPQCGGSLPAGETQVAIVGATAGHPFSRNPCLAGEAAWAAQARLPLALYLNLNWPYSSTDPMAQQGPLGTCSSSNVTCLGYNYGYNAASSAVDGASSVGVSAATWWLDVETGDHWSNDTSGNTAVVKGAVDGLRARGLNVGVYSISFMWQQLTGGYQDASLPVWIPGPESLDFAAYYCNQRFSFSGGPVWLVQYPRGGYDGDLICRAEPGWPLAEQWHAPIGLGDGPLGGPPVAVNPSAGVVDVFWKGTDGGLWHAWQVNGVWMGPQGLGGHLASDPSAVSPSPGVVDVFWKGTDGALWHSWYNSGWAGPDRLGGTLATAPQAVTPDPGVVDVFWRGPDQSVMHAWFNQGWNAAQSLAAGGAGDGAPFPVSSSPGIVDVFWKGADGNLWHIYFANGWNPLSSLGDGPLGSDPAPVAWVNGHIEVTWRGTDGGLWEGVYAPADGWLGPRNLESSGVTSAPVPSSWGMGATDVYWQGADGGLWHHWFGRSEGIAAGTLGSPPHVVTTGEGTVTVVWKGTDGGLWSAWYG